MAIVKHIKSRNANYSAAINYLLFEHDEKTGKKILDESGRSILRKEFYIDGLNCDPMSFDKECELTNAHFHKNKKREDIKSHHYIISYDPADVTENGLTGERAQAISLELAKQMFPGYQALVVTHTDGHNESGNIHTHIVINSVRKTAVERQPYMDKPHEEAAGYKHRSTDKFMNTFKKTVMDRCQQEGLHQIDLLAPAERKITQKEYMTQKHGQQNLDEINQKIIEDGLKPTSTVFLTQKEYLRNAIDECAVTSSNFDEFQSKLLELFQMADLMDLYHQSYSQKTVENIAGLPHPTVQKFMVITVAVVGASRRFLAQITRHQNEVKYMSASLQYSNYSGHAAFAIPYGIMKADKEIQDIYKKSCQSDLDHYAELCALGIDHDSAGYATPQGLRNVLIISATPYQWKHMIGQRTCRRNTDETRIVMLQIWQRLYKLSPILFAPDLTGPFCQRGSCMEKQMSCQNPISKLWIPSDILKADYPLLIRKEVSSHKD